MARAKPSSLRCEEPVRQGRRKRLVLCTRATEDAGRRCSAAVSGEGRNRTGDTTIFSRFDCMSRTPQEVLQTGAFRDGRRNREYPQIPVLLPTIPAMGGRPSPIGPAARNGAGWPQIVSVVVVHGWWAVATAVESVRGCGRGPAGLWPRPGLLLSWREGRRGGRSP